MSRRSQSGSGGEPRDLCRLLGLAALEVGNSARMVAVSRSNRPIRPSLMDGTTVGRGLPVGLLSKVMIAAGTALPAPVPDVENQSETIGGRRAQNSGRWHG